MTDYEPEIDDIRDMRKHGDLSRFMRQQIANGRARRDNQPKPVAAKPPGHQPGAWPAGTRPPDPPPPIHPAEVAAAIDDLRAHRYESGRGQTCNCKPCQQLAQIRPQEDQ